MKRSYKLWLLSLTVVTIFDTFMWSVIFAAIHQQKQTMVKVKVLEGQIIQHENEINGAATVVAKDGVMISYLNDAITSIRKLTDGQEKVIKERHLSTESIQIILAAQTKSIEALTSLFARLVTYTNYSQLSDRTQPITNVTIMKQ